MLIWGLPLLVTFARKTFQRRENASLSFCLHSKVRLHLLIQIKMSNLTQNPSIFYLKHLPNTLLLCCVTLYLTVSLNTMFMCLLSKENVDEWVSRSVYLCAPVGNIAGRLSSTNTGSLLPTFSYLYCFLSLSSSHCTDRGKRQLSSLHKTWQM